MALGSNLRSVLSMVAREALLLIGLGGLGGITLSAAAWRLLSERMPGVSPIDVQVLIVCVTVMLVVAVVGIAAAGALSSIVASVLCGVSTTDPVGLGGVQGSLRPWRSRRV